jgi:hypothetical protein
MKTMYQVNKKIFLKEIIFPLKINHFNIHNSREES